MSFWGIILIRLDQSVAMHHILVSLLNPRVTHLYFRLVKTLKDECKELQQDLSQLEVELKTLRRSQDPPSEKVGFTGAAAHRPLF